MSKKDFRKKIPPAPGEVTRVMRRLNDFFSGLSATIFSFIIVGIAVYFYLNAFVLHDTDMWWHIKYGEYYFQHRTWNIDHSMFSWTPSDGKWMYSTWLGSVAIYLIHLMGGVNGLLAFKWALPVILFFICLAFVWNVRGFFSPVHSLLLFLLALIFSLKIVLVKPDSFTILFFTLTVYIYFISKIRNKPWFFLYPLLFLVWTNIHGGFSIGLLFITLALILDAIKGFFGGNGDVAGTHLPRFMAATAGSYAVTLVNPYGIYYPLAIFKLAFSQHDKDLWLVQEYADMWRALAFNAPTSSIVTAWTLAGMMVILALVVGYVLFRKRAMEWTVAGINIFFFLFSMSLSRASFFFPIVCFFSLVYLAGKHLLAFEKKFSFTAFLVLLPLSAYALYLVAIANTLQPFSLKPRPFHFPEKAGDFLGKNKLPGPLFNDYEIGGYLIWRLYPEYKVFIDPRYGPHRNSDFWENYWAFYRDPAKENLAALESKRTFNSAVVFLFNKTFLAGFFQSPDWQIVYFDTVAAVFVRKSQLQTLFRNKVPLDIDLSAAKYKDVVDAEALIGLFRVYCMISPVGAKNIRGFYAKNVRNYYSKKKNELEWMDGILAQIGPKR